MNPKFLVLLLLPFFSVYTMTAQLIITPGSQFTAAGSVQLTLQNTDLINNGNFTSGNSLVRFTGNVSSSINGIQPIQFFEIELNKTNTSSVILERPIDVIHRILFSSGFLNLNGFNTDLGTTGFLDGEQESSRITGSNGGQVLFNTVLNASTGANPGNLGAIISSNQNLGTVILKRGHEAQINGSGLSNSILRYYDIVPANNSSLNATLRFTYFNGELNGFIENDLIVFKSDDGVNWSAQGFGSKDTVTNFVEKTGIGSFSRWTLSSGINSPLPLHFLLFNAKCEENKLLLTWKTAQEQNTGRFDVEKSVDATHWTVIGSLPASGNSTSEKSYSYTDNFLVQDSYYRIAEYDLNGQVHYTTVLRSSCAVKDFFNLWPNPVRDMVFINIVTRNESQVIIKVFDSKGALIKFRKENVLQGSNQLMVDMKSLASGVYLVQFNSLFQLPLITIKLN
jgi:hypothetical protein